MTPELFQETVKKLKYGKRLPGAIYLHRCTFESEAPELAEWITEKISTYGHVVPWTVIKLQTKAFGVSLLNYPEFFDESYPALESSFTIDFLEGKFKRSKYKSNNPPILHRKEVMLSPEHPSYEDFSSITREGEQAGLYENSKIIGFKQTWETLIRDRGYELVDGRLFRSASVTTHHEHKVDRHRTALSRDALSAPMKTLARHGYLEGDYSVFDYGCGRGDDLRELEAHGVSVTGWGPQLAQGWNKGACRLGQYWLRDQCYRRLGRKG